MEIVPSVNAAQNAGQAGNAQSKSDVASQSLAKNFDNFLSLLTTQLQHQNPLDPLKSNEFTQQLVSFSGVEQQIAANKNLEKLIQQVAAQDSASTVAYIGKNIVAHSDKAALKDGQAQWRYSLDAKADTVDITVKDSRGVPVFKTTGETVAGDHDFNWDGRDAYGNQLPDGYYTISVDAKTAGGNAVNTATYIHGLVDGVERVNGENLLSVNGLLLPTDNIQAIELPAQASGGV